jgi:hypothetical protein
VQNLDQSVCAIPHRPSNVLKAVDVVVGHSHVQRRESLIDSDPLCHLESTVSVADQDGVSSSISKRHNEVLNRVAVETGDINVVTGRQKIAARHELRDGLRYECPIARTQQDAQLGVLASDSEVLEAVAVKIAHCHRVRQHADIDLSGRLERAVPVTEEDCDAVRRCAKAQ